MAQKINSKQIAASGCDLTHSTTQSLANGSLQAVVFDTEISDTDSYHSNVTNTSRITALSPGRYLFTANVSYESNSSGLRFTWFVKNGATTARYALMSTPPVNGDVTGHCISRVFTLAASDFIEVYCYQNSGGALNLRGDSSNLGMTGFTCTRIGV